LAVAPSRLNPALPAELERFTNKALEKDPDLRYQSAADLRSDLKRLQRDTNSGKVTAATSRGLRGMETTSHPRSAIRRRMVIAAALAALSAIGIGTYKYRQRSLLPSNGRAALYVADFINSTGDTEFDDVLRDIVAKELNRSSTVQVVGPTVDGLMDLVQKAGKTPESLFTPELARQLCERDKGRLFTEGVINPQGSGYLLELAVRECDSGRAIAQQHGEAKNKDDVLRAASQLAAAARLQLSGKPANDSDNLLATLPTTSLAAYKDDLVAWKLYDTQLKQSAVVGRRATELDPNFADAWNLLSYADGNLEETAREVDDLKHAFALRNKLMDNEKASVEARYYLDVTGQLYKAIDALQAWEKLQPNEFSPHNLLGRAYEDLGLYEKATNEFRTNATLFPTDGLAGFNYASNLCSEGRYDEAESVLETLPGNKSLGEYGHERRYLLAMVRSDQTALERERNWMQQNADDPSVISFLAQIDLYDGRLESARQRTRHGANVSVESGLSELAAEMLLELARAEALYGESSAAWQTVGQALKLSDSKEIKERAARIMASNGQEHEAQRIIDELIREHPTDTRVNEVDAPLILAASQLSMGHAEAALLTLDRVKTFEFGTLAGYWPNYLRALAFLQLRRPKDAIEEFTAILNHRGASPLHATLVASQLGLTRAYVMEGDTAKARAAYDTFFADWKNADPDIPILKQAKAEYAKLN